MRPLLKSRLMPSDTRCMALSRERGMTIVEVMVAMFILLIGVLATVTMIDRANGATTETKARDRATSLARDLIEASRGISYPNLISTKIESELKASPGLEDANLTSPAYEIDRGNIRYTVTPTVCAVDDAKDGLGAHTGTSWCSGAAGTADTVPDDYRRVTVSLSWRADGKNKTMRQATTINNPGSAFGPAVTSIEPVGTILPIYDNLVSTNYDITTNRPADNVNWSVDGSNMGAATMKGGSDTTWSASWFIATLVDGTYLLSAQAYDASGLSAGPFTKSVVLNRFPPLTPTGLVAGATKTGGGLLNPTYRIDIEWLANRERDIVGYRVYRALGATANPLTDTVVCSVDEKTTSCDTTFSGLGSLAYYVVALDKDPSGTTRSGLPSVPAVVNLVNIPPTAVRNLTATTNANGTVTLSWQEPSSAGELTDTIEFYRIYRNGTTVDKRYARVGISNPVTYTAAAGHSYYVSAVDSQLGESPLSGPVP